MKIAVFGAYGREDINLDEYLPKQTDEILCCGEEKIHISVRKYAVRYGIRLTEVFPNYRMYKRGALIMRNEKMLSDADLFLIFWDGHSQKIKKLLGYILKTEKPYIVISKTEPVR